MLESFSRGQLKRVFEEGQQAARALVVDGLLIFSPDVSLARPQTLHECFGVGNDLLNRREMRAQ